LTVTQDSPRSGGGKHAAETVLDDATLMEIELYATEVVEAAGKLVSERFGGDLYVESKDGNGANPVTDVDRASQALIAAMVEKRFPEHMILGEEDAPKDEPEARDFIWVVDPIDGTTNYVNGHPVYAISIGVLHRGEPVVAAVWTPGLQKAVARSCMLGRVVVHGSEIGSLP